MNKFIMTTALALTLSGCVVGPPPDNERDRRVYSDFVPNDNRHDDKGYYDRDGNWHNGGYYDSHGYYHRDDDVQDDYNPHTGQDKWAKHSSK